MDEERRDAGERHGGLAADHERGDDRREEGGEWHGGRVAVVR